MLIEKIPANLWHGQRDVRPTDYPAEQRSLRADVAHYLRGRFRGVGDRLFVIPPDQGIVLSLGPFLLIGPGQFQTIDSGSAFDQRPHVRVLPDALTGSAQGNTALTVGETLSGRKVYTAIALHPIPDRRDELIGYFELEALIAHPAKGL